MKPLTLLISLTGLTLILLTLWLIVDRWRKKELVLRTSAAVSALNSLNHATRQLFSSEYNRTMLIVVKTKSKTQYDSRSLHQCLSQYLSEHYKAYSSIYEAVAADQEIYKQYSEDVLSIEHMIGQSWNAKDNFSWDEYRRIEEKIIKREKLPAPRFRLDVRKVYTSPKKQNHYEDQGIFYASTFIHMCEQMQHQLERRKNASAERGKMTNALRYQILQRDGFCCQVCGRSRMDGVVLHVDHIKPISKGGKTESENLRTLCADCNLGKGDRYDPMGIN